MVLSQRLCRCINLLQANFTKLEKFGKVSKHAHGMLDFLTTPYLLLGAAATAIPVLLHLILRNRAETVYFAAMRFLAATPKKLLRRQRLKQILLLLLRILALLLLGLIFARPLFVGDKLPAILGEEPRALALILDTSASMAANNHLAAAVTAAQELLQKAKESDQVTLIAIAGRTEVLAEKANPAQAAAALANVQQRQSFGNMRDAVQFADNLLAQSSLRRRQIFLFSDLQAASFSPGNLNLNSGAECIPIALKPEWQNLAVTSGERIERNGQISYVCRVRSFAKVDQEIEVRLVHEPQTERVSASKRLALATKEEETVYFTAAEITNKPKTSGAAYFEILAPFDDLLADNRFYLAPEAENTSRILLVSGAPQNELYLRQALELPGVPYRVAVVDPNALETTPLEQFEAVFFAGATGLNRAAAQNLLRYVQQGGGLIISFAEKPPLETFNNFLGELLPSKVLASHNAARVHRGGVTMTEMDFAHPIFTIFRDPSHGDPSAVQITRYYRLEPKNETLRLAGFEDGSPALLEMSVGKGKVLQWASTLDASGGNFPVRSIFVPMIHQWINYVRRAEAARAMTNVGQPVFFGEELSPNQPIAAMLPNGERKTLEGLATPAFNETENSGFYTFKQGRNEVTYAVNIDGRESDPAELAVEDVLARMNREAEQGELPTAFGNAAPSLQEQEKHQKLWRMGLGVLLALLLGEVWLANRTPR